jgi:hypothetical protein
MLDSVLRVTTETSDLGMRLNGRGRGANPRRAISPATID